ncbi:MAG: hypothetical protein ABH819_00315 [Patescibacteria group bacterium]
MNELENYAKTNSPYLMLKPGESVIGLYRGYKMVPNFRDPTRENPRYSIEVNGEEKLFTSSASRIALFFAEIKEGEPVQITKVKQGESVHYEVERADNGKKPPKEEDVELSDKDLEEIDKQAKKKT